ncbi:glutamate racemase [Litoribrevibacter albus]|uniref:Glutamate racemase n=1 Tax=Litoribrevibacter albus TaxID=1473156 RepID=A0AA37SCR5_9GAMM|nr:glutamate racemase [Litoribrevibacter albus]GLQ32179.1 glutamate racemase [Litoribrevibacter albus]
MTFHRILILDSGVGGLSVFDEIVQKLPSLDVDYLADHSFFPYGTKAPEAIISRVAQLVRHCLEQDTYSLIVVACNTASTVVLDSLRAEFDLPFVGVVPAIKPACAMSQSKRVGVLATEGTVTRDYTHELIRNFGLDNDITLVGSARLVEIAEQKLAGEEVDRAELKAILAPLKAKQVDQVVLGCTHFPLLKAELIEVADWPVNWVDSGQAIALRVESLLSGQTSGLKKKRKDESSRCYRFISTDLARLSLPRSISNSFDQILSLSIAVS